MKQAWLNLPETPPESIQQLLQYKEEDDLRRDLARGEFWLLMAASAAFLASSFFVVKYFVSGEMNPAIWTLEQWLNAFLGLGITAVITAAQAFLYSGGYRGQMALLATIIVVSFGVFSEVSQSMEREDATVRQRSLDSPVFQAALGSINTLTQQAGQVSLEQKALADVQSELNYWLKLQVDQQADSASVKYTAKTLQRQVAQLQAEAARLRQQVALQGQARTQMLTNAIQQAKTLEYDEAQHYMMIRLIKDLFGTTGIWASFLFSVMIIGTFEYAFHFVGGYVTQHRLALRYLLASLEAVPDAVVTTTKTLDKAKANPKLNKDEQRIVMESMEGFDHPVYQMIYQQLRKDVVKGVLKPTIRPMTDAIGGWLKDRGEGFGLPVVAVGKPARQRLAEQMLQAMANEGVLALNQRGGVGVAKYVLV